MINRMKKEVCCGCEACSSVCPTKAIEMKMDNEGFYYPEIKKEKCILCNRCEKVCPICHKQKNTNRQQKAYACYNKNEDVRRHSTSGGIFSVLADYFVEQRHGLVYGARFDEKFMVIHDKARNRKEIEAFCGSKYVQSQIGEVYHEIKEYLEEGQNILFSGLPCQVEGLKSYLEKDYNNLCTIDLICFGIGSPLIWENYLKEFHNIDNIEKIVFKDKKTGWKEWKVKFIEGGQTIYYEKMENLYMNSYLQKINIRPSCFQCKFKGIERKSDFTIADCWGIGEENKNLNDNKGLSALLVHSHKAAEIFDQVKNQIIFEEYIPDELMKGNWATYNTPQSNMFRQEFFDEWNKNGFKNTFQKYFEKRRMG